MVWIVSLFPAGYNIEKARIVARFVDDLDNSGYIIAYDPLEDRGSGADEKPIYRIIRQLGKCDMCFWLRLLDTKGGRARSKP